VTAIHAGFDNTCVVLSNGSAKCWGEAPEERVGTGETGAVTDPSSVGPIQITTNPDLLVTELATGASHVCARLSDGSAVCWGGSAYGALGYGNIESIGDDEQPSSAGAVSVTTSPGVTVTQLAAGSDFTCALLSDHSVKCWGDNRLGELGNGKDDGYAVGDDELPSTVGAVTLF
jgi:alpha-tubulin suppressor-like RCC1 family protein